MLSAHGEIRNGTDEILKNNTVRCLRLRHDILFRKEHLQRLLFFLIISGYG